MNMPSISLSSACTMKDSWIGMFTLHKHVNKLKHNLLELKLDNILVFVLVLYRTYSYTISSCYCIFVGVSLQLISLVNP